MAFHGDYQATLAEKLANPAPRAFLVNVHASAVEQDRQQRFLNDYYWRMAHGGGGPQRQAARRKRSAP
jgi:hypothetical protein